MWSTAFYKTSCYCVLELTDQVVMRFTQNTYTGTIDSSGLSLDDIILGSGYAPGTEFILTGGKICDDTKTAY